MRVPERTKFRHGEGRSCERHPSAASIAQFILGFMPVFFSSRGTVICSVSRFSFFFIFFLPTSAASIKKHKECFFRVGAATTATHSGVLCRFRRDGSSDAAREAKPTRERRLKKRRSDRELVYKIISLMETSRSVEKCESSNHWGRGR